MDNGKPVRLYAHRVDETGSRCWCIPSILNADSPPLHPHRDSYLTVEIRVGDNDDDDDLRFVEEDNFGKVNKFHDLGDNSFLGTR